MSLAVIVLVQASFSQGTVRWAGGTSIAWETASNWVVVSGTPSTPPGAADAVQIGTGAITNQPTITSPTTIASLTYGNAAASTLTINGNLTITGALTNTITTTARVHNINLSAGVTLFAGSVNLSPAVAGANMTVTFNGGSFIVSGNFTAQPTTATTNITLTVGTGTFSVGGTTLQGAAVNAQRNCDITVSTGSLSFAGAYTKDGAGSDLTSSGAASITFGGNVTNTRGTSFNLSTATTTFTGSGTITPTTAMTFGDVTVTTGAATTLGTGTISTQKFTVIGTASIGGTTLTVNDSTDISGTLNITSATGTKIFVGPVTLKSGAVWNNSGNESIVFRGGLIHNGATFTSGTGTYTFNTNNQEISGSSPIAFSGPVAITGAITVTNKNTVAITGNLTGSVAGSTWANDVGSVLNVAGTLLATGTLNASANSNTVNYNGGGAQTIKAATYHHLTLSNAGAKTAGGALTVNGNLTLSGTATFNGGTSLTHNFGGSWIINTTAATPFAFTTSSTINFNTPLTPAPTSLGGTTAATIAFNSLNINNTSGFNLDDNISASGTLTVASNVTFTPLAAVIISGTGTLTGNGTVRVTRTAATADFTSQYTITNKTLTNLTVDYAASGQVLSNLTYGHLKVSGSITGASNSATVGGAFTVTGTFTPTSGTITMNNGSSIVNSGVLTFPNLTVANSATVSTSSSFGISGALSVGTGANFSPSAGSVTMENGSSIANSGTLQFNGLSIANSANVTTASSFVVNGNFNAGAGSTFSASSGTITMNGSTISGGGSLTFNSLTVGSSLTSSQDFTVNGTLTLNNDLSMGSNTLSMGGSATTAGTADVTGNVQRTSFITGTSYTFGNQFTSINFASGVLPTSIVVNISKGSTPSGKSDAILRSYGITATGGSGYSATLRLHYLDTELNSNTAADLALWSNSGSWIDRGRTGSVNTTNKWAELTGLANLSATWTLANASLDNFLVSLTSPQLSGVAFTGTNTITARDQNGNTITSFNASANNVTVTSTPNDGTVTGLGSSGNNVLNQSGNFVNGVANVTGTMRFVGQVGNHTFTATSANGKTGTSGTVVINRITTNWKNTAVSSDWNNPANWTNGVPDSTMSVVISNNSPAPHVPTSNAHCFDLTVNSGGLLQWDNCGGILYIHGNIVTTNGGTIDLGTCTPANQIIFLNNATFNNGGTVNAGNGIIDLKGSTWQSNNGSTFDPGTSTVIVDGTGSQTFNGNITFYNLTVSNTSGTVTFSDNVTVSNDMTVAPGSNVQVGSGGSITVEGNLTGEISSSPRPFMTSVVAASSTQVDVTFNISVDPTTSQTAGNYSINSGSVSVTNAVRDASNHAIVHLTVATLTAGVEDTLVVSNVQDTLGNAIVANSKKRFTLAVGRKYYSRASGNWSSTSTWSTTGHGGSAAASIPTTTPGDTVEIASGHSVTLDMNVSNTNIVTVGSSGTLILETFTVSGGGTFTLEAGGTLVIGSSAGISSSGSTGNIQTSVRNFSKSATYQYGGGSTQVTGTGLPDSVAALIVAKTGGATLTLTNAVQITGNLSVASGVLDIGTLSSNHITPAGGTLQIDAGATLKVGGSSGGMSGSNFPANFSSYVLNGTVEFNGTGAQTIPNLSYTNLVMSGGTKSFAASMAIPGDLIISSGVLDLGSSTANRASAGGMLKVDSSATLRLGGSSGGVGASNFPANYATVVLFGTVEFNGGSGQTIPQFSYTHVVVSNAGEKIIDADITAGGNVEVTATGVLTINAAKILTVNGYLDNSGIINNNGTILRP